jgi:hypothetical protein
MSTCDVYTTTETVYLGHDNAVSIIPYSDFPARTVFDMTAVTLVAVSADLITSLTTGDDVTTDSDDVPITVWWNQDADGIWQIHMKVGMFVGIAAGSYKLRVVITDPAYANGLVIADDLLVDVVDVP